MLDPPLFLIVIRDIDQGVKNSRAGILADDCKITKSTHEPYDVVMLLLYDWASRNNMELNGEKLKHLRHHKITHL